jgi:hypothetical protein
MFSLLSLKTESEAYEITMLSVSVSLQLLDFYEIHRWSYAIEGNLNATLFNPTHSSNYSKMVDIQTSEVDTYPSMYSHNENIDDIDKDYNYSH